MTIAGAVALTLAAATLHAGEKPPKCFKDPFEGHCVAAKVNGQDTVKITKKTRKVLKQLIGDGSAPWGNCEANYEVPAPVRGGLDVRFTWRPEAVGYFGPETQGVSVLVHPLEGQALATHREISTAPSVQAGGSAVMTQADVVDSNRLPAGKYVFIARVSGSVRSWDCHGFFVEVAAE